MSKAVIFMPYDPDRPDIGRTKSEYGAGELDKNRKVKEFLQSKGFLTTVIWYDGKPQPQIQSLDTGQLYIRGHGMPGMGSIFGAKSGGETVPFNTVFERLVTSGLPKTFGGEIHCYNCNSAANSPDNKGDPYAVTFANFMYSQGYKSCKYFGYLGLLDSFQKDGSKGTNIYAREFVYEGKKRINAELGTWDQARVRIHPKNTMITHTVKLSLFDKIRLRVQR